MMGKSRDKFVENTGSHWLTTAEKSGRTRESHRCELACSRSVRVRVGTGVTPAPRSTTDATDATDASSTKNGTCHHLGLGGLTERAAVAAELGLGLTRRPGIRSVTIASLRFEGCGVGSAGDMHK
jgi:hypothetical protein